MKHWFVHVLKRDLAQLEYGLKKQQDPLDPIVAQLLLKKIQECRVLANKYPCDCPKGGE